MSPLKTLLSILSLFVVLGIIALVYPEGGIHVGDKTLRYPKLTDIFVKADVGDSTADSVAEDPEVALQEMLDATREKEFAEYSDSLKFYEDFFEKGKTRFDLPGNDPTWFDRFFLHLQLAELDSNVVHIVHYGDSQLEEDRISATIREDLQSEFGGAGPGMLPAILTVPSQTTSHSNSGDFTRYILFGPSDEEADHNRYGPLAQFADLKGSAMISIKKRKERKDNFPHVGGYNTVRVLAGNRGNLKLKLVYDRTFVEAIPEDADSLTKAKPPKKTVKSVEASAPSVKKMNKLTVYTWKLPDTTSSAKIYLNGNAEIYAISADGAYGVAVDNVAMRGSSGTIFHRIDPELLAESYKAMNARLIIMEYGGNMVPGMSGSKSVEWLKKVVTKQIVAIQAANPDADILFIGPADMARQQDGQWQTYPGLAVTIKTLREIALENGLAYWDMHRVMGGNGSMIKWVNKEPALGFTDHIHFTRRGAAYMGDLFCASLHMYYDFFKFRDRHDISDQKLKEIMDYADSVNAEAKLVDETSAKAAGVAR